MTSKAWPQKISWLLPYFLLDLTVGKTRCLLKVKVAQSCLTLCNPMNCTVHGILQARILEWVAFPFSRGSSQPRDWTQVSRIAGGFFTIWATREAQKPIAGTQIALWWGPQGKELRLPTHSQESELLGSGSSSPVRHSDDCWLSSYLDNNNSLMREPPS